MPLIDDDPPKHLAARPIEFAVFEVRLAFGLEPPIVGGFLADQAAHARRHADQDAVVLAACFEQQNLEFRICRQAVGQDATGAAGAHDDVVEFSLIFGFLGRYGPKLAALAVGGLYGRGRRGNRPVLAPRGRTYRWRKIALTNA